MVMIVTITEVFYYDNIYLGDVFWNCGFYKEFNMAKAFVILKPDCYGKRVIGEVITRFERKGFEIERMELRHKSEAWARSHYSHLTGEVLDKNVTFMTCGPLIGIVLEGPAAIVNMVKAMIGPTNSALAAPGTIRGDFGTNPIRFNVIHCSDFDVIDSEIKAFFGKRTDYVS
jgi:nucleoside-diphosphate kinase